VQERLEFHVIGSWILLEHQAAKVVIVKWVTKNVSVRLSTTRRHRRGHPTGVYGRTRVPVVSDRGVNWSDERNEFPEVMLRVSTNHFLTSFQVCYCL
jgi:hypothetical protein